MNWPMKRPANGEARYCDPEACQELTKLLDRAVKALEREDRALAKAFKTTDNYKECAHGLSYWLFEHNLVFPIFRDWITSHQVLWDVPADAHEPWKDRPATEVLAAKQRSEADRKVVDLQVVVEAGARWFFEAKWWAKGASKDVLGADATALRKLISKRAGSRGFLLVFWYGVRDEWEQDFAQEAFTGPVGDAPTYVRTFRSHVYTWWREKDRRAESDGYFAVGVWEVQKNV